MMDTNPKMQSKLVQFELLHYQFREAVGIFFKGSTLLLAIIGVGIGYLLKTPMVPSYASAISGTILVIILFWYVCSTKALRTFQSLRMTIEHIAEELGLEHDRTHYDGAELILKAAYVCLIPISGVLIWFFLLPPKAIP